MNDSFDEAEVPDEQNLPFPPEKVDEKLRELQEVTRKFGLYLQGATLGIDEKGDEETGEKYHKLYAQFLVGDIAWSSRVQDPEQDKIDNEFRSIAVGTVEDDFEEIRKKYQKKHESDEGG